MSVPAWPADHYLLALGRLAYAVSALEWAVLGDLPHVAGTKVGKFHEIAHMTTVGLGKHVKGKEMLKASDPRAHEWLKAAGTHLEEIGNKRNSVLHARPALIRGDQCLYRCEPRSPEFFVISDFMLDEICSDVERALSEIDRLNPLHQGEAGRTIGGIAVESTDEERPYGFQQAISLLGAGPTLQGPGLPNVSA